MAQRRRRAHPAVRPGRSTNARACRPRAPQSDRSPRSGIVAARLADDVAAATAVTRVCGPAAFHLPAFVHHRLGQVGPVRADPALFDHQHAVGDRRGRIADSTPERQAPVKPLAASRSRISCFTICTNNLDRSSPPKAPVQQQNAGFHQGAHDEFSVCCSPPKHVGRRPSAHSQVRKQADSFERPAHAFAFSTAPTSRFFLHRQARGSCASPPARSRGPGRAPILDRLLAGDLECLRTGCWARAERHQTQSITPSSSSICRTVRPARRRRPRRVRHLRERRPARMSRARSRCRRSSTSGVKCPEGRASADLSGLPQPVRAHVVGLPVGDSMSRRSEHR